MKIDRIIGIITILLQRERTTIPQLAERFEVSGRTIQRDIDHICGAGIPIVSVQGYGGGLSIAEGYRLDKTVLTREELQTVLAGVRSIDSVSKMAHGQTLAEKFQSGKNAVLAEQGTILIDLASWYQDSLPDKIEALRQAVARRETVRFVYHSDRGEGERTVEPYLIVFKWAAWYLYGYCLDRQGYRLFKLGRLWQLENTGVPYTPRSIPQGEPDFTRHFGAEEVGLTALFDAGAKRRLIEAYGPGSFSVLESGQLFFQRPFVNRGYLLQWVLSFGDGVEVLEPLDLREEVRRQAENILRRHE